MSVHQFDSLARYVRYLQENPQEVELLCKELLIGVTNFFRDPELFEFLKEKALPELLQNRPARGPLRVWNPGCSTGEETYSLAIVLKECMEGLRLPDEPGIQIFATDLDQDAIDKARRGTFSAGIAADVSPERLQRFFVQEGEGYRIKKEVRDLVVFAPQNILVDPPFTKLDLLCCRNLLIYLNAETQRKLLPLLHFALNPGGLLVFGAAESTGGFSHLFSPLEKKWKVFRCLEMPGLPGIAMPAALLPRERPETPTEQSKGSDMDILYEAQRAVGLLRPAVGGGQCRRRHRLCERADREIPGARLGEGQRQRLCDGPRGAPRGVGSGHSQRRDAKDPGDPEGRQGQVGRGRDDDQSQRPPACRAGCPARLADGGVRGGGRGASPRRGREGGGGPDGPAQRAGRGTSPHARALQTTVEEMQTTQEELRSVNEELQSNNEELQSTNEELNSSKEELQSLNEEMQTVNAELQTKMDELSQSNSDMKNLLNGIEIATIFLDNDLNVKRFTPEATRIVNLVAGDVGRPLSHFATNLKYKRLVQDASEVLDRLVAKEAQVEAGDGRWYHMRVLPYRTADNVIDGVVMTFADITPMKQLEASLVRQQAELQTARDYAENVIATVREPLLVLDGELRIVSASRSFYETFRVTPAATEGRLLYEIGHQQWEIPSLRQLLADILAKTRSSTISGWSTISRASGGGSSCSMRGGWPARTSTRV